MKLMLNRLDACEIYLRDYDSGAQTVVKLLQIMKETRLLTVATMNELCDKHKLPDDLREILTKKEDADLVAEFAAIRKQY